MIAMDQLRCSACNKSFRTVRRSVACPNCGFRYVFLDGEWTAEVLVKKAHCELRVQYVTKGGASHMETIQPDAVADRLARLAKRRIEAYVHEFTNGKRGECVGSTGTVPGRRGFVWWCNGDLANSDLQTSGKR